jgi:hypothetical protein
MELTWESDKIQYSKYNGKLGKYICFTIFWNSSSLVGDNKWSLSCKLPGIKNSLGDFKEVESAKIKADAALKIWLTGAGL